MRRRLGPRFGAEAGLIAASALVAALLELEWPGIVAVVLGTWLAIAAFEIVWSRTRPRPAATEDAGPAASPPALPPRQPAVVAPALPEPAPAPPPPAPTVEAPGPAVERAAAAPGPPRSWNLWELERAARGLAGADAAADEERQYMLIYLREFASPDGKLPIDFDPLVREAFGEGLAVAS